MGVQESQTCAGAVAEVGKMQKVFFGKNESVYEY